MRGMGLLFRCAQTLEKGRGGIGPAQQRKSLVERQFGPQQRRGAEVEGVETRHGGELLWTSQERREQKVADALERQGTERPGKQIERDGSGASFGERLAERELKDWRGCSGDELGGRGEALAEDALNGGPVGREIGDDDGDAGRRAGVEELPGPVGGGVQLVARFVRRVERAGGVGDRRLGVLNGHAGLAQSFEKEPVGWRMVIKVDQQKRGVGERETMPGECRLQS